MFLYFRVCFYILGYAGYERAGVQVSEDGVHGGGARNADGRRGTEDEDPNQSGRTVRERHRGNRDFPRFHVKQTWQWRIKEGDRYCPPAAKIFHFHAVFVGGGMDKKVGHHPFPLGVDAPFSEILDPPLLSDIKCIYHSLYCAAKGC